MLSITFIPVKMKSIFIFLVFSLISNVNISAQQPTIGLQYFKEEMSDGYVLFSSDRAAYTFLINNCGQLVNEWTGSILPQFSSYLLEDGSMIRLAGEIIEKKSWDDELIWRYYIDNENTKLHHDLEPLPNGNVLVITYDIYTEEEAISNGRNPENLFNDIVESEKIIEIKPISEDSFEIVWEWKLWDHLVQDQYPNLPNYGQITEHPNRLNINYQSLFENGMVDWMHFNGIDYNPSLDQIILSSRHTSELYIIDHSTTTEEAMSSSGGNSNKGGDILWRWGNPRIYNTGTIEDKKLFGPHDPQWVQDGYPNEGKISVFNNGWQSEISRSSIHLIEPRFNEQYTIESNDQYFPDNFYWSFSDVILDDPLNSPIKSGVQALWNGNFLITEGVTGRMSELSLDQEVLWVYTSPIGEGLPIQYNNISAQVFKASKYPSDYPIFTEKNISIGSIIEDVNPVTEECLNTTVSNLEIDKKLDVRVYPTMSEEYIFIETLAASDKIKVEMYNLNGQRMLVLENQKYIDISEFDKGLYILKLLIEGEYTNFRILKL